MSSIVLGLCLATLPPASLAESCRQDDAARDPSAVVTVHAVGDIVIGSDWPVAGYPAGFEEEVQARLRPILGEADVIFGNLEGALTTHDVSTKPNAGSGSVFAFRMPPRFAGLLRNSGLNVLHIANNHTFDFDETGFRDTLSHLAAQDIHTVGERGRITLQRIRDVTVAWIGFSYAPRHNDMHDPDLLALLIRKARGQADLVIVSIQAGAEGSDALRVVDREETFLGEKRGNVFAFSRRAVDLGADLVLGHGPHVLRGMECYSGKLIAYSLGNFVGYGALSAKRAAALSAVLTIKLSKDRRTLGFDVIPLRFDDRKLPERDNRNLARYLINDLSRLPPLSASVKLPTAAAGEAAYREWLSSVGLGNL